MTLNPLMMSPFLNMLGRGLIHQNLTKNNQLMVLNLEDEDNHVGKMSAKTPESVSMVKVVQ